MANSLSNAHRVISSIPVQKLTNCTKNASHHDGSAPFSSVPEQLAIPLKQKTYRRVSWCVSSISSGSTGKGFELGSGRRRQCQLETTARLRCSHVMRIQVVVVVKLRGLLLGEVFLVARPARALATAELGEALGRLRLVDQGRHQRSSVCTNTGKDGRSECGAGTGPRRSGARSKVWRRDETRRTRGFVGAPLYTGSQGRRDCHHHVGQG